MGLRCLFVAYMTASPRCSRAAHALTSGSCHCPTSPSGDLGTKSRVACILRSTWSFKLHIVPHSAPRRSASRVMLTSMPRCLHIARTSCSTLVYRSHSVLVGASSIVCMCSRACSASCAASYSTSGSRHYTSALSHIRHVCARGFRIDWVRLAPKHPTSPSASF